MTVVVSDTSVLCYLALLGRLDVLGSLFKEVVIPGAVLRECLHPGAPRTLREVMSSPPAFFKVNADEPLALPETASLDSGEAAAIAIAWQHRSGSLLLLDEKRGRSVARSLGLRMRGTLGIVVEGHRRGLLEFEATTAALRQHGFRIASTTLALARLQLGLTA
jgi:predicted nucleic acid-binding protein